MKTTTKKRLVQIFLTLALAIPAGQSSAADSAQCEGCSVATDQELGTMRAGYDAGGGLEILVGIKEAVFFNGVLQVVNTLNLPELVSGLGQPISDNKLLDKVATVLQFGGGNSISPGLLNNLQSGHYTFIQNSLDHAVVRKVTEITASVTALGMYRDMNLRSMMNQQLINAAR